MSTHTFTKHLHEIIFYTPHSCETTAGAFLSEASPITTKYRRKRRWNAIWHTDIQMKGFHLQVVIPPESESQ
ncbi:hypothetical protein ACUOAQ_28980, partial [Escherichia sp. SP-MK]